MIVEMDSKNICDIYKPNQPFDVIGRLTPSLTGGVWSFSERLYDKPYEKSYPDEDEDYSEYIGNPDKAVYFFYDGETCVGQIRLTKYWNRYAFIQDIAVSREHRGKGVGTRLIETAIAWAKAKGLRGLMLETQDVNLLACRFYRKQGFVIGGVDTMLYANFNTADETAIFWYMKF